MFGPEKNAEINSVVEMVKDKGDVLAADAKAEKGAALLTALVSAQRLNTGSFMLKSLLVGTRTYSRTMVSFWR